VRFLGGGATSRVLLAERGAESKALVVVKLGRDMGQRPRFADEAERLCLVDSPWVAPLLDVGALNQDVVVLGERFERGAPFLVFAWEEGETLATRSAAASRAERRELALVVARDIGAALADLHGVGSAHGDIKPQNIVLTSGGARLIDFGLAGDASAESASGGTRRYLAPEVMAGAGSVMAGVVICSRSVSCSPSCWSSRASNRSRRGCPKRTRSPTLRAPCSSKRPAPGLPRPGSRNARKRLAPRFFRRPLNAAPGSSAAPIALRGGASWWSGRARQSRGAARRSAGDARCWRRCWMRW
jgi:serine/threonine protein kinase